MYSLLLSTISTATPCLKEFQDTVDTQSSTIETKDLLYLPSMHMYLSAGSNPIEDSVWTDFWKIGYLRLPTTKLLFSTEDSCLFRSIDAPPSCTGSDCFPETIISDTTWIHFVSIIDNRCIPEKTLCPIVRSEEGLVQELTVQKCHTFVLKEMIYELQSPTGSKYAMHAYRSSAPDLDSLVLPKGWIKQKRYLEEPLVIKPMDDKCSFILLKDHLGQTYHRIE